MCICGVLTGLNFECERVFLLDGVCEEEAGVAAVVCVGILSHDVGEVEVAVHPHGHSLILRDWSHSCGEQKKKKKKKSCHETSAVILLLRHPGLTVVLYQHCHTHSHIQSITIYPHRLTAAVRLSTRPEDQ